MQVPEHWAEARRQQRAIGHEAPEGLAGDVRVHVAGLDERFHRHARRFERGHHGVALFAPGKGHAHLDLGHGQNC